MIVKIKDFYIDMEVKNNGIEFEVRSPSGEHLGDCRLTKTKIVWHEGRSSSGPEMTWEQFMTIMKSPSALTAALQAAKEVED